MPEDDDQLLKRTPSPSTKGELDSVYAAASEFLRKMDATVPRVYSLSSCQSISSLWSPDDRNRGQQLARAIRHVMSEVAGSVANSPLVGDIDRTKLRTSTKQMEAAVTGVRYYFAERYFEEGFGFRPESEGIESLFSSADALKNLVSAYTTAVEIFEIAGAGARSGPMSDGSQSRATVPSYKNSTAFLMMWIDKEFDDLVDAVKDVFRHFGIAAQRADEIEHEGIITSRILEEITRSEFLFADLTGARPSVYYEVGYAPALGKRVILYRRHGAPLHFDLAGHNCPEYDSLRDLKMKLTSRLAANTGKIIDEP